MIKSYQKVIVYALFSLFVPIIYYGSSRLYIAEFISFIIMFDLIVKKRVQINAISYCYSKYLILYTLAWLVSIVLSQHYEHQQFATYRIMFVTAISSIIFSTYFKEIKIEQYKNIIIWTFSLFLFVHLVSYLQYFYFDMYGSIFKKLYDPLIYVGRYWTLEKLLNLRVPSVFKDYFTGSMFLLSVVITATFFYFRLQNKSIKIFLIVFIVLTLLIEIITSRTSLYGSLISIFIIPFLAMKVTKKQITTYLIFILAPIFIFVLIYNYFLSNFDYLDWAFELLIRGDSDSWSGSQFMMDDFINQLSNNAKILFFPLNNIIDYSNPFYSDNYYFQEIVRTGIYGIFVFILFAYDILKYFFSQRNYVALFFVAFLIVLNWKGGNTFFVERSSIITVFCLTLIDGFHNAEKN